MCNSLQHTPARTAHRHHIQAHHEASDSSPTGVMDRQIFCADDEKELSGARDGGSSRPDQQHDCKKNPNTHNDDNDNDNDNDDDDDEGKDSSSRPPPGPYQHAVPRSISITSSNASPTTSADRTDEALLTQHHDSSSSLSSISSIESINENPPDHPRIEPPPAPTPVSEPKTESKSPISPRRAIFDSYWKRSPTPSFQQQPRPASKPTLIRDSKDEVGAKGPVPEKTAVHAALPPPPPLVQVEDNDTAKAFFGIVGGPTRDYQPEAKRSGTSSLGDILAGLLDIIPPIPASPAMAPKPTIKSTTSPKSHLTRTGLLLAHQASCGGSSRRSITPSPPSSPQTPRPKVPTSPATLSSPSSPLPSCLRHGSRNSPRRKYSQDEERTCDSTPSSSSERLSHVSTDHKAPVVRVRIRSNSTVSFCPSVHIIEFDNSRDMRDEEIIRSPRAKKESYKDWNDWFAA